MRILMFIIITTFLSCSSTKKTESRDETIAKPLNFEVIAESSNSGFLEQSNRVIENIDELDKTWETAFINYTRKKPIPILDFEKQSVLLVTMGEKSNGGFSIKVDSVKENENLISVNIIELHPGKSCATESVIVYPFQIISLEKTTKKVVFKTVKKVYNCEK